VAYTLWLPASAKIHPTFHVSQLKRVIASTHSVCPDVPDVSNNLQVPLEILDRRIRYHNNKMVQQVLVRWSHTPSELSTWEDEEALRQEYPRAPA
jgi:hypothetical protein